MKYLVTEYRQDLKQQWWVAARPGYRRCADGTFARDGLFSGGPEWTTNRANALEFSSKRAAQLVRAKSPFAKVVPI